jgi:N-dimethylarginine dimethylaminohydrolase
MKISIKNDYDFLEECILCQPCNLQRSNSNNIIGQIDKGLVSSQYNKLVNSLIDHGTRVLFLDPNDTPSQVFTRDIGFVIDDILFISSMKDPIRKSEINILKEFAQKYNLETHIMEETAEGGDILVKKDIVFVGQGKRTTSKALAEIGYVLQKNNKPHKPVPIDFNPTKIHLDCVCNILNENTCIASKDIYNPETFTKYFSKVIWVPDEDLKDLAPNIVRLDKDKCLSSSKHFTNVLKENGFDTIYIDFSEIIKCNGSIGCCVLPLYRKETS